MGREVVLFGFSDPQPPGCSGSALSSSVTLMFRVIGLALCLCLGLGSDPLVIVWTPARARGALHPSDSGLTRAAFLQDHYDWGLRAIKSVLVVAGSLKRGDPDRPEDQVLMRSLRDFNIPKIVTDDVPVFMGLIGDLFPALDVPRRRDLNFEALVRKAVVELKLQAEDNFVLKVHGVSPSQVLLVAQPFSWMMGGPQSKGLP